MAKAKSPQVVMNRRKEVTKEKEAVKETERRGKPDRRKAGKDTPPVPVAEERRVAERRIKQPRRRQIDPTTCERDYNLEEIEFMHALDAYKRSSGRMFPTCSEILEVIRGLGYVRLQSTNTTPAEPVTPVDSLA